MNKLQKDRISKLSKRELELEILKLRNYGNSHNIDEDYLLKLLKDRKEKERQKVKEQAEFIKKVPSKLIKGDLFLEKCKKQVKEGKPLTDNVFRLFKEAVGKKE